MNVRSRQRVKLVAAVAVAISLAGCSRPSPGPAAPAAARTFADAIGREVAVPATASFTRKVSALVLLLCSALAIAESSVLATKRADLRDTNCNTACACNAGKP